MRILHQIEVHDHRFDIIHKPLRLPREITTMSREEGGARITTTPPGPGHLSLAPPLAAPATHHRPRFELRRRLRDELGRLEPPLGGGGAAVDGAAEARRLALSAASGIADGLQVGRSYAVLPRLSSG